MADKNFPSGMVRSSDVEHLDYTSLPLIGLIGVARTAAEGAAKYGRLNYVAGAPCHDYLNHAINHIVQFSLGDRDQPHLPHAAWNILAAIQSLALAPELSDGHLLGPGATLSPACRELLDSGAVERARLRAEGAFEAEGNWKIEDLPEIRTILSQREKVSDIIDETWSTEWPDESDDFTDDDRLLAGNAGPETPKMHVIDESLVKFGPQTMQLTYIAGPMSGLPDHNFPAFEAAAQWLRGEGYPVHSPHNSGADQSEDYQTALKRAMHILLQCKQVVMLPGWETSTGATAERVVAIALQMPVKYLWFFNGKPVRLSDKP